MNNMTTIAWLTALASFSVSAADLSAFPPTRIASGGFGSISPVALSQLDITDDNARLYQSGFDNYRLTGDLMQHAVASTGSPSINWSAASTGIPSIPTDRMVIKGSDSSFNLCGVAQGSIACSSSLGPIIHSNPVYVGKPPFSYDFNGYASYTASQASRSGRIYAGANDGMLHAFDMTGMETFGYIPSMVESSLPSYEAGDSPYFVDGPLVTGDAYHTSFTTSGNWKTLLLGGLGAGGQGYFALDVTTPVANGAAVSTVAATKQWEFTPAGIGYTYGAPIIGRTNLSTNWVLIAANGYKAGGEPILYVRDINTPATVIRDFDTLEVPIASPTGNGLSSPSAIDIDGDAIVDYVYAGDLNGNLWRFDLTDATASNWSATKLFTATDGSNPQPILAAPELALLPGDKVMVYIGTGDYLGVSSATQHSLYAIKDTPTASVATAYTRSNLQARATSVTSNSNYLTVDESAAPNSSDIDWSTQQGWYLDLGSNEHILQRAVLYNGRIQFMSHNPSVGDNWFIQLDWEDGRLPDGVTFDTNADGALSAADNIGYVSGSNPGALVVAEKLTADLISGPTLARKAELALAFFNQWHSGTGDSVTTGVLAPKSCTSMGFDRFDFTTAPAPTNYSIKFIAHLTNDPADDIWIMRSGMNGAARTIGSTQTPPPGSGERGAGTGTTTAGNQSWSGLTMYLGDPGSDRVSMNVEYEGPYQINSFTIVFGNNKLRRIHDGVATCNCTGRFHICDIASNRIDYGTSNVGVSAINLGSGWTLNSSSTPFHSGSDKTVTTPGADANGSVGSTTQPLQNIQTGRLLWRELLF